MGWDTRISAHDAAGCVQVSLAAQSRSTTLTVGRWEEHPMCRRYELLDGQRVFIRSTGRGGEGQGEEGREAER